MALAFKVLLEHVSQVGEPKVFLEHMEEEGGSGLVKRCVMLNLSGE